jgi:hypothetical protein
MSGHLIIITGLIYAYVAAEQFFVQRNLGMAIVYAGYSFSNIGLFLTIK